MPEQTQTPLVSVIIPMRNEERHIAACLDSVLKQDYPREQLEVILADGMSTDRTRELAAGYTQKYPFISVVDNPLKTPGPALNIGIRRARGRYILRMDAHAEYGEDYISQCVRHLELTGAENVGGPVITCAGADTPMARCIKAITSHKYVVGGSAFRTCTTPRYTDTCVFGAWPRELFDRIGYFNEALTRNQDYEFNSRILRYGGKIFQTPAVRVWYYNQSTLGGLCRQAYRNGAWNVLMLVAHPAAFRVRHFAPFFFVLALLGLGALSWLHPIFAIGLGLVVLAYAGFLGVVTAQVVRQEGQDQLPLVPAAVACYHLAYGWGTFVGIWRFLIFGAADRQRARAGSQIPDPAHPPQLGTRAVPEAEAIRL